MAPTALRPVLLLLLLRLDAARAADSSCNDDCASVSCLPEWWRSSKAPKLVVAAVLVFFATFLPRVLVRLLIFVLTKLPFMHQYEPAHVKLMYLSVSEVFIFCVVLLLLQSGRGLPRVLRRLHVVPHLHVPRAPGAQRVGPAQVFLPPAHLHLGRIFPLLAVLALQRRPKRASSKFLRMISILIFQVRTDGMLLLLLVNLQLAIRRFVGANGDFSKKMVISESVKVRGMAYL